MPAWWSKKSRKTKDSAVIDGKNKGKEIDNKTHSFDEVLLQPQSRNSPRSSRDYSSVGKDFGGRNSSGFSGFDSASSLDKGHPLPKPSDHSNDHAQGTGSGSGSASVSSVSSSGSYDDHTDHAILRGNGETRLSPIARSPGSRSGTSTTSPLHSRQRGINLDSPTGKLEDGRSDCHRLPLPPSSPTSPSALPTPRSPGRTECPISHSIMWRKGRLLGKGTFGHVYLGFNSESGQMCAIKEVKVVSDDQSSKESLKQLNQEINLLRQLSHPNIVRYYGSDLSEQSLSVYLEYVSGGSIHKLLQEYGPFAEPVIQNYTRQILAGLSYLHGRNTVHRDIKGANILVDPNGEIKLADFGMAKHIASASSMLSFKGSPYWMAPEVVMNKNGYSLPVDIWSLGCTVLEMAMAKPPWSQYEGVAAIFKIGNSRDIPDIPDSLSADARSFIRLCLQREPGFRPTASQLLTHPFIRHQTTGSPITIPVPREAFPRAFDGSRTPPILEIHTSKTSRPSLDIEDAARLMVPRTLVSPRDYARNITSLPVSPSSSPLRSDGARRNFFLSPPHPSYTAVAQGSQYNDHSIPQFRPNSRNLFDPPEFRSQASARSPARAVL